jgi:hypothetical protein
MLFPHRPKDAMQRAGDFPISCVYHAVAARSAVGQVRQVALAALDVPNIRTLQFGPRLLRGKPVPVG